MRIILCTGERSEEHKSSYDGSVLLEAPDYRITQYLRPRATIAEPAPSALESEAPIGLDCAESGTIGIAGVCEESIST